VSTLQLKNTGSPTVELAPP